MYAQYVQYVFYVIRTKMSDSIDHLITVREASSFFEGVSIAATYLSRSKSVCTLPMPFPLRSLLEDREQTAGAPATSARFNLPPFL